MLKTEIENVSKNQIQAVHNEDKCDKILLKTLS